MKPVMIDIGSTLGKIEEVHLEDGTRSAQLTLVQPATEDQAAASLTIFDLQGIRNLQMELFSFFLDYDEPPKEDTIPSGPGVHNED